MSEPSVSELRVLVVDDDDAPIRPLLRSMLEPTSGARTDAAPDARRQRART